MPFIMRFRRAVEKAMDFASIALFSGVFLVVLLQIWFRYVVASPLVWSEELSRILFIWVSFIGWTIAMRHGSHIRVAFFLERMPPPVRRALEYLFMASNIFFMLVLVWVGARMTARVAYVSTTTMPFISNAYIYAILPFSAAVCVFYLISDILIMAGVLPKPADDGARPQVME